MKVVYSIKINNPVVFTECIKPIAIENKYELFSDDMNDFRFCPWLIAYYEDDNMQINNINEGFYNRIKNDSNFQVNEYTHVRDFLDNIKSNNKPNYELF